MALFDFLKRKKEIEKTKEKSERKAGGALLAKTDKKAEKEKASPIARATGLNRRAGTFSYQVVREPHVSEKATYLGEANKYVFKVYAHANKTEIKKSVEGMYGVDVLSVNIIKIPGKKRRLGRTEGFKKGHTKAIVTIKKGQKIEIL